MLITRKRFEAQYQNANLDSLEIRQQIAECVLDEVADTRFLRRHWCVNGFPPLDMSGKQYLRPVGCCRFGANGWEIRFAMEWFDD